MSFDPTTLGELYPFTPRQFTLSGGATMSYLDEGDRDAPTLLMVHGNPTWSFYYRDVVKAFSSSFRCVVPDHIGAGLSDKPADHDYTLATHIANLRELTDSLELRDVTLLVHDWGGPIGLGWALQNRELLRRLVLLNTSAFRSTRIPFSINICRIPGFGALAIRGLNGFARAAVIRATRKKLPAAVARGYTGPYDSWANRIGNLRFVQDIPMHPGVPSWEPLTAIEEGLPSLRELPMLICWGGRDFCFNDTFLQGFQDRLPEAEVHRFADAGHYVLEDAGEQVIERMKGFFARTAQALTV